MQKMASSSSDSSGRRKSRDHVAINMEPADALPEIENHSDIPTRTYLKKVHDLIALKDFHLSTLRRYLSESVGSNDLSEMGSKVVMFKYGQGTRPGPTSCTNIRDLRNALCPHDKSSSEQGLSDTPTFRLFLLEDPSGHLIEMFGSRFNIDPLFFEAHIVTEQDKESEQWRIPRLLASGMHRQWFQLRNSRLTSEYLHDKVCRSNISREQRSVPQSTHSGYFATQTRTTVWVGKDHTSPTATIGVILIDATATPDSIYGNLDLCVPPPDLNTPISQSLPRGKGSWFEDIVGMCSRHPWFASTQNLGPADHLAVVFATVYAVCAEWLVVSRHVTNKIGYNEELLRDSRKFTSREQTIDLCLWRAEDWRIIVREWREMVREMLDCSLPIAARLSTGTTPLSQTKDVLEQIMPDVKRISQNLEELEARADRLIDRCTGEMQLAAARESLAESHNLARLTWLATIFIPLTFVTGLFSMNEDIGSLRDTFATYFAAAVPVAIVALVTARWGAQTIRPVLRPFLQFFRLQVYMRT